MKSVVLATCLRKLGLQPSDMLLEAALAARGLTVSAHPWNGPFEPFRRADLVVIRSTWDYVDAAERFSQFIDRLGAEAKKTVNPPALMKWNLNKTYLLDLGRKGATPPPTAVAEPTAEAIREAMGRLKLDEAVVKPVIGASAAGLSLVEADDWARLERAAKAVGGLALVQPLIPEIRTLGETSLVFFAGEFSHALLKKPKPGSILVQEEHGGATALTSAPPWAIEEGRRILALLPEKPVYARVDWAPKRGGAPDGGLWLMEVELIEPELFLVHDPAAAGRFADALMRELKD
jgi:glutathione synthase/RimK-type ligase-like ATP-grasp enzyme